MASSRPSSLPTATTEAPREFRRRAVLSPRPELAPVTKTVSSGENFGIYFSARFSARSRRSEAVLALRRRLISGLKPSFLLKAQAPTQARENPIPQHPQVSYFHSFQFPPAMPNLFRLKVPILSFLSICIVFSRFQILCLAPESLRRSGISRIPEF